MLAADATRGAAGDSRATLDPESGRQARCFARLHPPRLTPLDGAGRWGACAPVAAPFPPSAVAAAPASALLLTICRACCPACGWACSSLPKAAL
jgi:hypothetical protein